MAERASVFVEIDGRVVRAGELFGHRHGRTESATFRYDSSYVADPRAYPLDPNLPLSSAPAQTALKQALFGCFADSAPDRWGRLLVTRSERARADADGTLPRELAELDFLVGVRDDLRQGAIRLADGAGAWLAPSDHGLPLLVDLPKLLSASDAIDRDDPEADQLRLLFRAGSSLGGARPKANVVDVDGAVVIAKFPRSRDIDHWDVVRWEGVALELARRAGIRTPASRLVPAEGRGVLLVRRFDREGERRIGYASAMTMLERLDGDRGTYVEIAEVVEETGSRPLFDLQELWRRIVFGVLIRNTDDHLRNHGFLRDDRRSGWRLAPAFDLNPNPESGNAVLSTSIDGTTDEARLDVALEVAPLFRLNQEAARRVVGEVAAAIRGWRALAAVFECAASEIKRMERAFEHPDAEAARRMA